ncbi:hypothetical protein evm_010046 [Chilo suppressalis]|nr:hypothetical protein evm_010046 [Chilo suppressalis]
MLFYRLVWQRFVAYFRLDELFKGDEARRKLLLLLHKKRKVPYKTKLITDQTLNFYITVLLSIIGTLICLSIPFAALETPCTILKERGYHITYFIAVYVDTYLYVLDIVIISFILVLIYVTTKMYLDAIKRTKINISPWVERGKYKLPDKNYKPSIENMSIPGEEWMISRYNRLLRPRPNFNQRRFKLDSRYRFK